MTRVQPDAIWEVAQSAARAGTSMRQAVLVLDNPALSVAAGCHGNTVDSWARRMQLIYDARLNFSLQGVRRFNLPGDGSTHSCKDVLVGVIYSHENDTGHCPMQMILPTGSDKIKPDEMELADPIALLAQDNKVKRLSSHRQLQAISHQLHLLTCARVRDLDYFRVRISCFVLWAQVKHGPWSLCLAAESKLQVFRSQMRWQPHIAFAKRCRAAPDKCFCPTSG